MDYWLVLHIFWAKVPKIKWQIWKFLSDFAFYALHTSEVNWTELISTFLIVGVSQLISAESGFNDPYNPHIQLDKTGGASQQWSLMATLSYTWDLLHNLWDENSDKQVSLFSSVALKGLCSLYLSHVLFNTCSEGTTECRSHLHKRPLTSRQAY